MGVHSLIGTVVSSRPESGPRELILALSDNRTPEVTLRFVDQHGKALNLKKSVEVGNRVAFEGIAKAFKPSPFMLFFDVGLEGAGGFTILEDESKFKHQ